MIGISEHPCVQLSPPEGLCSMQLICLASERRRIHRVPMKAEVVATCRHLSQPQRDAEGMPKTKGCTVFALCCPFINGCHVFQSFTYDEAINQSFALEGVIDVIPTSTLGSLLIRKSDVHWRGTS